MDTDCQKDTSQVIFNLKFPYVTVYSIILSGCVSLA